MQTKLKKILAKGLSFVTILFLVIMIAPPAVFGAANLSGPTYNGETVRFTLAISGQTVDDAPDIMYGTGPMLADLNNTISMEPDPVGQLANWRLDVSPSTSNVVCGTTYRYVANISYDDGTDVTTSPIQTFNIPCGGGNNGANRFSIQYGTSSTTDSITVSNIAVLDSSPQLGTPNLLSWNIEVVLQDDDSGTNVQGFMVYDTIIRQIPNVTVTTYPSEVFTGLQSTGNYTIYVRLYNDSDNNNSYSTGEELAPSSPQYASFNPLSGGGNINNTGGNMDNTGGGNMDNTGGGNMDNTGGGNMDNTGGGGNSTPSPTLLNPISVGSIQEFIAKILDIVLTIGVPIVALAIIYSGFLFVMARGNTEKLETAKETLVYVLIGAALLLGAWVIANAIVGTINQLRA